MPKKTDKKFRTLSDLNRPDSEDSDDEKNLFTGGEKSGLEVEKPPEDRARSLVEDILHEAAETAQRGGFDDEPAATKRFYGGGYRLGSEEGPSERIAEERPDVLEKVKRTCTFWKDGFSIDDGPLYRFDDPENKNYLAQMKQGNAPLGLFNVLPGQRVDIEVKTKSDQNYKPPKKSGLKFSGQGHRLGSPVPGEVYSEPMSDHGKEKVSLEQATESAKEPEPSNENDTVVQVRLADGRKLKVVVDKTGPVKQVFDFVNKILEDSREYFLSLPYPVKPITDQEISIQEAKLAHSVVIQRWK